jgi:hypothetical protein
MNIYKKFVAGAASAILLGATFVPSVLASTTISGNGVGSTNTVVVLTGSLCDVDQSSNTNVLATVSSSASTGGNQANGNTGAGDISVTSGAAVSSSSLTVTGGDNTATNPCCGCQGTNPLTDPTVSGNGVGSKNTVLSVNLQGTFVDQKSKTNVTALVVSKAKTGKNKANGNTGAGSVSVTSGPGTSATAVSVTGGSNSI